jgi:hypothetical protein
MPTLQNLGKAAALGGISDEVLSMAIIDSTGSIIEAKAVPADFYFDVSASGMILHSSITFTIPADKVVTYIRLYATATPTNGIAFVDYGVLPGTTAERTFVYEGAYILSGYTITAA